MMINLSKKYRYRCGDPAQVLCVDRNIPGFPVLSLRENGRVKCHHADGRIGNLDNKFDLIEVTPYDDFHDGDIVAISACANHVTYREWAHVDDEGNPCCYNNFGQMYSINLMSVTITLVCRAENRES